MPIICIGNLSMGGTGKTPHTEYLIKLLHNERNLAVLSRGYGRKTSDFIIADDNSTSHDIGDEPLQMHLKYPDIKVAVENKRVLGILNLLYKYNDINTILLDDAFQHRSVKAGLNVVLTSYNYPFYQDYILPIGNLRELTVGINRADIIIVTKCPETLSKEEQESIKAKIQINKPIYFSSIVYGEIYSLFYDKKINYKDMNNVLLVTAIANALPLKNELLNNNINVKHLEYRDHYNFTNKDADNISACFESFALDDSDSKIILTTQKDAMRMKKNNTFAKLPIFVIEIKIDIINDKSNFNKKIIEYAKQD